MPGPSFLSGDSDEYVPPTQQPGPTVIGGDSTPWSWWFRFWRFFG
jgi:hypothetical protein